MLQSSRIFFTTLLVSGAFFSAPSAVGSEPSDKEFQNVVCQFLGQQTEKMAEFRDKGYAKEEILKTVRDTDGNPQKKKLMIGAAEGAYSYPRMSPREEGNQAYMNCIEQFK